MFNLNYQSSAYDAVGVPGILLMTKDWFNRPKASIRDGKFALMHEFGHNIFLLIGLHYGLRVNQANDSIDGLTLGTYNEYDGIRTDVTPQHLNNMDLEMGING